MSVASRSAAKHGTKIPRGRLLNLVFYFPAFTELTAIVSLFSVPVTVTVAPACLSSVASASLSVVSSVYTLSPTTRAYFEPLLTHSWVQEAASPAIMCFAPHMLWLTTPVYG